MIIDDNVEIVKQDQMGWLVLRKNTFTPEFRYAFFKAMTILENDDDVRVVLLKSAHDKIFFAGADIKGFAKSEENVDMTAYVRAIAMDVYRVMERLEYFKKPSIAVVDGAAVGGGCELTIACDITLASERAIFGQPEVKLGLVASAGGVTRLPQRIGKQRAMELLLTGKLISANEAYEIGLINKVFPKEKLYEEAEKMGQMIAANAPLAVQATKDVVSQGERMFERGLGLFSIDKSLEKCMLSQDLQEGAAAFIQKRKPEFKGI